MAQRMKFGYIVGTSDLKITETSVSAAAGVVKCKNDTCDDSWNDTHNG